MTTDKSKILALEALRVAIKAIQEIREMESKAAEEMLRNCWNSHVREYQGVLRELALKEPDQADALTKFSRMVALATLDAYFEEHGNWGKMIKRLEARITQLGGQPSALAELGI